MKKRKRKKKKTCDQVGGWGDKDKKEKSEIQT